MSAASTQTSCLESSSSCWRNSRTRGQHTRVAWFWRIGAGRAPVSAGPTYPCTTLTCAYTPAHMCVCTSQHDVGVEYSQGPCVDGARKPGHRRRLAVCFCNRRTERLKLLVTSATLDGEKFSAYFNNCPVSVCSATPYVSCAWAGCHGTRYCWAAGLPATASTASRQGGMQPSCAGGVSQPQQHAVTRPAVRYHLVGLPSHPQTPTQTWLTLVCVGACCCPGVQRAWALLPC